MTRHELQQAAFGSGPDPLWVPLLSHYAPDTGPVRFDRLRTHAHIQAVRPYASQFLIAGLTGDGWEMAEPQFRQLLEWLRSNDVFDIDCRVLIGTPGRTTDEVLECIRTVSDALPDLGQPPSPFVGIVVCPPVNETANQDQIEAHFRTVLDNTTMPVAVYQLPRVTGCRIQPKTLQKLALDEPRVILFVDSSGPDFIAKSGTYLDDLILVRGADGGYAEALEPIGPYDGLLVSTANVFARELREILDLLSGGAGDAARAKSADLAGLAKRLFAAVGSLPVGNTFANANRIVDHFLACGAQWNQLEPPLLHNGSTYELDLMTEMARIVNEAIGLPHTGYLARQGWSF